VVKIIASTHHLIARMPKHFHINDIGPGHHSRIEDTSVCVGLLITDVCECGCSADAAWINILTHHFFFIDHFLDEPMLAGSRQFYSYTYSVREHFFGD